jgi:hypothetical protein
MKRPPIYYAAFPHTPMPRRIRFGRWEWQITDGMTGPVLASGTAPTRGAALRRRIHAELRCRSEQERLDAICAELHEQGIDVEAHYDKAHRVCVRPCCDVSTRDETRALAQFLAITSAVVWEVAR